MECVGLVVSPQAIWPLGGRGLLAAKLVELFDALLSRLESILPFHSTQTGIQGYRADELPDVALQEDWK